MIKFAHTSDIHLGFQKDPALQDLEIRIFDDMMDGFVERKVDFVLMPGDIFHTNIPRMKVQKAAFEAFRKVHDVGIPIYVVYGSHDFSPVSDSVIDLLASAGYVKKVMLFEDDGNSLRLGFIKDNKTGTKIAGLFGLKQGKDEGWYERLEKESLEKEKGFKIFLFHGAVSEMNEDEEVEKIPMGMFPKTFHYYAGGHMHKRQHYSEEGYAHVVYPGTPFCGFHKDMEDTALGETRGYYIVEWDGEKCNLEFIHNAMPQHQMVAVNADGLAPEQITAKILRWLGSFDPDGQILIITISGMMASGRASQIDANKITGAAKTALACVVRTSCVDSPDYDMIEAPGEDRDEIIANVLGENVPQFKGEKSLEGEAGVTMATTLLRLLEKPKQDGQTKFDYEGQVTREALAALGLLK